MKKVTVEKGIEIKEKIDVYEDQMRIINDSDVISFGITKKSSEREDEKMHVEVESHDSYFPKLKNLMLDLIMENLKATEQELEELEDSDEEK